VRFWGQFGSKPCPAKPLKQSPPHLSRSTIAERLLDLEIQVAPAVAKISEVKEDLRFIADEQAGGFVEDFGVKGAVEVKAGRERQFKGTLPVLNHETWLTLSPSRQDTLIDQCLVVLEQQWSPAARPSVTVRL
jgi:hypothetical protein